MGDTQGVSRRPQAVLQEVPAGEAGVAAVLAALSAELDATLALLGLRSVAELRAAVPEVLRLPPGWD